MNLTFRMGVLDVLEKQQPSKVTLLIQHRWFCFSFQLYEDVEFGLLEEEAGWLARREELHRDRAAAVAVRRARRARAEWLRAQLDQLRSVGDDQLRALRHDINAATLSIQQVRLG